MTSMNESSLIEPAQKLQVCKNMLAIASGKGGVGKTWLSVTLAQAMARSNGRVLLFDGDLGLANVDIQLGLQPGKDLSGALAGNYPMAEAATRHPGAGFEVIAGRSGTGGLASLPASRASQPATTGSSWISAPGWSGPYDSSPPWHRPV